MPQIVPLNLLYERIPARTKRFNELIVFIHHYNGHKHSFRRHIEWLNDLGYDCITFDLPARNVQTLKQIPIDKDWNFGLRFLWAEAIDRVLGALPEIKIIYSFSFPSVSALMAIERRHGIDVKAWICDGGPFKNVRENFDNLSKLDPTYRQQFPKIFNSRLSSFVARASMYILGVYHYDEDVDRRLNTLPKGFPILSIRSDKDPLVPPATIEMFFSKATDHVDLRVLNLPNAVHVSGLKSDQEIYQKTVRSFLNEWSTQTFSNSHALEGGDHS